MSLNDDLDALERHVRVDYDNHPCALYEGLLDGVDRLRAALEIKGTWREHMASEDRP